MVGYPFILSSNTNLSIAFISWPLSPFNLSSLPSADPSSTYWGYSPFHLGPPSWEKFLPSPHQIDGCTDVSSIVNARIFFLFFQDFPLLFSSAFRPPHGILVGDFSLETAQRPISCQRDRFFFLPDPFPSARFRSIISSSPLLLARIFRIPLSCKYLALVFSSF